MCQIEISRSLAARVGTHEAHVRVVDGDTVRDIIERMAEEYGSQVRAGMLDGDRLRSDVIAKRTADGLTESVTADSPIEPADELEFHLTSEHDKVTGEAA
jgi:adenylylsulfate kinase-like enzyme